MKFLGRLAFLFLFACLLASCDADVEVPPAPHAPYASPTAPESLITNLQLSYRQREIKEYAKLLAPEFVFKFRGPDTLVHLRMGRFTDCGRSGTEGRRWNDVGEFEKSV